MDEERNAALLTERKSSSNEKIFDILFDKDEITWQTIIYELINSDEMDPWDIDISLLTHKYIAMLKKLKELDFRISGKVVLAASILLKIKSNRLVGEDLEALDQLFAQKNEDDIQDLFDEEVPFPERALFQENKPFLLPRTPQPRKRKVSVYDLVNALEKALEVKRRRVFQSMPELSIEIPKKSKDITSIIKNVYYQIKHFFSINSGKTLTFTKLLPSESKEDKVYTFIPLLHLAHLRKIDLKQDIPFSDIEIIIRTEKEIEQELANPES